jgi:hypothetical protein
LQNVISQTPQLFVRMISKKISYEAALREPICRPSFRPYFFLFCPCFMYETFCHCYQHPHHTNNMARISIIFIALAVATVCNAAWLAEMPCDPATNATQGKGRVINGNCMQQSDGSYLLYTCGPNARTAVQMTCSDSACGNCKKVNTFQTNNGICNSDDFMYMCFPKIINYAKVAGSPNYLYQNKYTNGACSGQPTETDVFSVGRCVNNGKDYVQIVSCSSTDASVDVFSDPGCTVTAGSADVFLNICYGNTQSTCVKNN